MPALVARDGNTLHIFLNGAFYDISYTPVVTQMNDLCSFALQNAAHDIDSGIMAIKKCCGCYDPNFILCGKWHEQLKLNTEDF